MLKHILQSSPWSVDLDELVKSFRYKPGWTFRLMADYPRDYRPDDPNHEKPPLSRGTTLVITSLTYNSYREYSPSDPPDYRVQHPRIVPPATWNRNAWKRWILEQCLEVEQHEACEFARFVNEDGSVERPFSPLHGPGENPYTIHQLATDEQRRTSFRGEIKES